jgi:Zn-dependent peptidase ImmA (M78 family)
MNRIPVNPTMLIWARERSGLDMHVLFARFPKLADWEAGAILPTLRQLEQYAHAVHVPIGYLFLPVPPNESLPIADYRTQSDRDTMRPSPDLLETVYLCQQRQDWFREYARQHGLPDPGFVGSIQPHGDVFSAAAAIRSALDLTIEDRAALPTWTDALRQMMVRAEELGVLVMASSIVGSNSHRKLSVAEFRGFALADSSAPLVFINAADSKAAQMFTLAHELVHVWVGESGVFDVTAGRVPRLHTERWCNAVAAEILAPVAAVNAEYRSHEQVTVELQRLARMFKVSTLVVLRRLHDAGRIDEQTLWTLHEVEVTRFRAVQPGESGGGDFYRTLGMRTGKRFARAMLSSTLEGHTLFQDAFRMLGVRSPRTIYQAARELGVMP